MLSGTFHSMALAPITSLRATVELSTPLFSVMSILTELEKRKENLFLMWDTVLVLRGDPTFPMRKGRWLLNLSEGEGSKGISP